MAVDASLRLLRAFVAVAHEKHLGRAARRLFVTQPALSQDVRKLEERVGVQLFERSPRGMELTPAGKHLFAGIESALGTIDSAVALARESGRGSTPAIRLAFSPSVGNKLIPALLPLLEQGPGEFHVEEREVDTGDVASSVARGESDLGLAHCPDPHADLIATAILEEELCAVISIDSAISNSSNLRLSDLEDLSLILWPRETSPTYYDHLLAVCHQAGLQPNVLVGSRRAVMRSYMLTEERAFLLLPRSTENLVIADVRFIPLIDPQARVTLYSIRRLADKRPDLQRVERRIVDLAAHILHE